MSPLHNNRPLPFPAEEIRCHALETLSQVAHDLHRLLIFWRGKQRSTRQIELLQVRILSLEMSIAHLRWDQTQVEDFERGILSQEDPPIVTTVPDEFPISDEIRGIPPVTIDTVIEQPPTPPA